MIIIIFYNGNNLGIHLIIDYGLPSFYQISRRSSFASLSDTSIDDHRRRQSAIQVYLPPEVRGMLDTEQPSPTTDVYRQAFMISGIQLQFYAYMYTLNISSFAIILIEIATRMDPFSV